MLTNLQSDLFSPDNTIIKIQIIGRYYVIGIVAAESLTATI